jgi:dimethylhistidine N-methyltransferase
MELPEYYLTKAEFNVLERNRNQIFQKFRQQYKPVDLIEFGAGDGYKTKLLIETFLKKGLDFRYTPIDISEDILLELQEKLKWEFPDLQVNLKAEEYFVALDQLKEEATYQKAVLFLGSNIGNFNRERALHFLSEIANDLNPGDWLLAGFDLKKNPHKILAAYNDSKGVTRQFNINLLSRINRELDANFDLSAFIHYPYYDIETGEMKSYLVSTKEQTVRIGAVEETIEFKEWEFIHTEISKKYDLEEIESLASETGFEINEHFFDESGGFVDSLWQKR